MKNPTRLGDYRSQLAECPTWHPREKRLYWTDIPGEQLLRYSPRDGVDVVCDDVVVGGFTFQDDGSLLLFMDEGTVGHYQDGTLTRDVLSLPDVDARFNDLAVDPAGRVFCGTMSGPDHPGHLYRLDRDGSFEQLLKRVQVPNGLGFSPDFDRLYFAETNNRLVHGFEYDMESGSLTGRETFADFRDTAGKPDGLSVDRRGNVWSALWGAGVVECFSPDGTRRRQLEIPAQYVTSVTFGDPSDRMLYVTTAQASEPDVDDGGRIFMVEADIGGMPYRYSRIDV